MGARVMVMAGGTGGHVYPALAVADELRARGLEVIWLGAPNSFESRVVPPRGIELETIRVRGLRGKGALRWLALPFTLGAAVLQARTLFRRRRPALALGMGGFASGPGGLAARLMRIPLVIHEQNAIPGLTNRWLARLADRVAEAFPGSFRGRAGVEETGNPLRREIAALAAEPPRSETGAPLRLLVLGGSLGAQALNETLPAALALMAPGSRPRVRHQAGAGKEQATKEGYAVAGIEAEVAPFIEDMAEAYRWADLVVCRAGALTISELAAAGVGAILVPYPHAVDDHQTRNAAHLVDAGAARLLPQPRLDPQTLARELSDLSARPEELLRMAAAARGLARPGAAERVADLCEEAMAHG